MKSTNLITAIAAALCFLSSTALAEGALLKAGDLPESDRDVLASWISDAKQADPEPFRVLKRLESQMPALNAQKRGRFVPVTRSFRHYQHRALPAIVERLVFNGGEISTLSEDAKTAFLTGIVQVLGEFVDVRVEPVLHALLDAPSVSEFHLVYVVSGALGWHRTAAAERHLLSAAAEPGERQFGVLAGLGQLHTTSAVERLAVALRDETDAQRRKWLIRSVRDAGNRGFWRIARTSSDAAEEWSVRLAAMQVLVDGFITSTDDVQAAAANAIMVVDHPDTPAALLKAQYNASPALTRALVALQERFANPPLMRRRK